MHVERTRVHTVLRKALARTCVSHKKCVSARSGVGIELPRLLQPGNDSLQPGNDCPSVHKGPRRTVSRVYTLTKH